MRNPIVQPASTATRRAALLAGTAPIALLAAACGATAAPGNAGNTSGANGSGVPAKLRTGSTLVF